MKIRVCSVGPELYYQLGDPEVWYAYYTSPEDGVSNPGLVPRHHLHKTFHSLLPWEQKAALLRGCCSRTCQPYFRSFASQDSSDP